jgi:hypothetical protein
VVLDFDEATADDIVNEVSMRVDPESAEYSIVNEALANGSTTRRSRYERFDRADSVRFEDAVYEVSETRMTSSDVTVYEVRIDFNPTDTTPDHGEIAYDDLPAVDRQRLDGIISRDDSPSREGYDVGVDYGTAAEVGNESVFVPDREYDIIVYDDQRYRVAVDSRTASEGEYRYEVTEVAPDIKTYANQIREKYRFTLTGLSDAERAVVEEAIEGGYFEEDDAFRSVVERLRSHEGLSEEDFYGTWLLEYEGVEYLVYAEW